LVMSATVGMGSMATTFYNRLASSWVKRDARLTAKLLNGSGASSVLPYWECPSFVYVAPGPPTTQQTLQPMPLMFKWQRGAYKLSQLPL
jgi:hypothetical protein